MQTVNYIAHSKAVFEQFRKDSRLNPSHISLYMALFQFWNHYHFKEKFFVQREEIMRLAKLGSKNTYHKCIKELDSWKYLKYLPSHNPFKGSQVIMLKFDTSCEQAVYKNETTNKQLLGSNINHQQTDKNTIKRGAPPSEKEVMAFFEKKKWTAIEGKKFYFHYQSVGWVLRDNHSIRDWMALAEKWMLRENENKKVESVAQKWDNLRTPKDKNYAEPL